MGTACYAGALMLQALGLGGWMYTGLNPFSVLGASGDPAVPGLGFRFEMLEGNPLPHVTGLPGVFEAHVPPHHADMRAAVEAVVARKFGAGRAVRPEARAGPTRRTRRCGRAPRAIDAEAVEIATLMADYVFAHLRTVPGDGAGRRSLKTYLQAHRLDTEFYDRHFAPGAYLRTHAEHDRNWG